MHCHSDPDTAEAFASEAARRTGAHGRPCSNTHDLTAESLAAPGLRGNKRERQRKTVMTISTSTQELLKAHAGRGFSDDPALTARHKIRLLQNTSKLPKHGQGAPGLFLMPDAALTCASKLRVVLGAVYCDRTQQRPRANILRRDVPISRSGGRPGRANRGGDPQGVRRVRSRRGRHRGGEAASRGPQRRNPAAPQHGAEAAHYQRRHSAEAGRNAAAAYRLRRT
jgi:hypothetical protein